MQLDAVRITPAPRAETHVPTMQQLTLPSTQSITATQVKKTVNVVDPEDAVKYLPSLFVRKRNYGDTQATLETRVWGVSSSARSLVLVDGAPISAFIANNNTIGGPRWGLVSPDEIARVDVMYGPFSAAYAGNSMGAVVAITTRQPDSLEASVEQTEALQHFSLYGTRQNFLTSQTNATLGDRFGNFSFWVSGNYENSLNEPLTYATNGSPPSGTTGAYLASNKSGAPADVLGATGILHTGMTNGKVKLAYDITPALRATYTFGYWRNGANAGVDTYLSDSNGDPTFAGQAGFASGFYHLIEDHTAQSLALRTSSKGDWDFEAIGTLYRFGKDQQRFPTTASASGTSYDTIGRVAVLDGTGWSTIDLKGAWHRGGPGMSAHMVTFGGHGDWYTLFNPTYNTPNWESGPFTTIATEGNGKTRTQALWVQDAWRIIPTLTLTVGGRYEWWRAFDGVNVNGSTTVVQPPVTSSKFSPKGILDWAATPEWHFTASVAQAYRFATPAELYQLVSTGATYTSPDPNLKPDNDLAAELRISRMFDWGTARLSLFQDNVHDAIIAQYLPLVQNSTTLYSYLANVDHVRGRGVELEVTEDDMLFPGLSLTVNGTYLDARTLALSGRASATAPAGTAVGKFLPNIPKWRAGFSGVYQPARKFSVSLSGRYSTKMYTTLDNSDVNPDTYQGFSEWFVMDARASYRVDRNWSASLGVDNLLDRKYFLFHPFPQRTVVGGVKYQL